MVDSGKFECNTNNVALSDMDVAVYECTRHRFALSKITQRSNNASKAFGVSGVWWWCLVLLFGESGP